MSKFIAGFTSSISSHSFCALFLDHGCLLCARWIQSAGTNSIASLFLLILNNQWDSISNSSSKEQLEGALEQRLVFHCHCAIMRRSSIRFSRNIFCACVTPCFLSYFSECRQIFLDVILRGANEFLPHTTLTSRGAEHFSREMSDFGSEKLIPISRFFNGA